MEWRGQFKWRWNLIHLNCLHRSRNYWWPSVSFIWMNWYATIGWIITPKSIGFTTTKSTYEATFCCWNKVQSEMLFKFAILFLYSNEVSKWPIVGHTNNLSKSLSVCHLGKKWNKENRGKNSSCPQSYRVQQFCPEKWKRLSFKLNCHSPTSVFITNSEPSLLVKKQ